MFERLNDHRTRTMALLAVASAVDAADAALLPPMFLAISVSFQVGPVALSEIVLAQSLSLALSGPVWAFFADRSDRIRLVTVGCALWGLWTCLTAQCATIRQLIAVRALVGSALASLSPVINSLVGDLVEPEYRGRAYGGLALAKMVGKIAGGAFATRYTRSSLLGMEGWRGVNVAVGGASLALAFLFACVPAEPSRPSSTVINHPQPPSSTGAARLNLTLGALNLTLGALLSPLRLLCAIPSALLIVGQGVVGGIPWSGFSFVTMMLQSAGCVHDMCMRACAWQ